MKSFAEKVYALTKKIPQGRVATYGQMAKILGKPKAGRLVGLALHRNPYAPLVPCHRVISSKGELLGFAKGLKEKKRLLEKEGIRIQNGKVDCQKYLWQP